MRNAKRRLRSAILAAIALAALAALALEFGGAADVARSAPAAADVDISLDNVTILGADLDGNTDTIEVPLRGNKLDIPQSAVSAKIVKLITITVPSAPIKVHVSGEFVPPNSSVWRCAAPFVPDAGGDATKDQGCTVGSPDPHFAVVGGPFRGLPTCQWNSTTETGVAPKVVMPWPETPYLKCERFVDESTLVAVDPAFQAGGGAAGCRVAEVTPAAWAPAPIPNPYNLGDCILDWHVDFSVVAPAGQKTLRVVDELELQPPHSGVGKHIITEDFNVMPVGDTDPDLTDNALSKSFEVNIVTSVGGLAELPGVSDSSGRNYVALAGLAAVGLVVALSAGGWYARRRWLR
jgi:hypothetical protein